MPGAPRLDLNAAAARVAAAFGFTVRYRETLEPTSGRIEVVWTLNSANSDAFGHTLALYCQPSIAGVGGWAGWVALVDGNDVELVCRTFIGGEAGLAGKKAGRLTRARFCEWALKQEPESRVPHAST